jgi:FKBP-type peptidyl-prolyl cis-trans isomerase FkpA
MRMLIPLLIAASLALPAAAEPPGQLNSEDDKVIYIMGVSLGQRLATLGFDAREVEIVKRGLSDSLLGNELAVDGAAYGPKLNEFAASRTSRAAEAEKEASQAFLADAEAANGAVKTESGLIYSETKAGTGANPTSTDKVTVHYHGTLRDGTVFDSSRDRGEPATFPLNGVIQCWTEALQRMKVGGEAAIVCPADIAYGDRGAGAIKPGAALRFEVELISIQ